MKKRMNVQDSTMTDNVGGDDGQVQNMYMKAGGVFENQAEIAYTTQMFENEMQMLNDEMKQQ